MQKIIRTDRLESVVSRFNSLANSNNFSQELLAELNSLIADSEEAIVITADTVIEAISEQDVSVSANKDIEEDFHRWRANTDMEYSDALDEYYESDSYQWALDSYKDKVVAYCLEQNDYGLCSLQSAIYEAINTLVETAN